MTYPAGRGAGAFGVHTGIQPPCSWGGERTRNDTDDTNATRQRDSGWNQRLRGHVPPLPQALHLLSRV